MAKFCASCGVPLEQNQSFCDKCGAPWSAPTAFAAAPSVVASAPTTAPAGAPGAAGSGQKHSSRPLLIILLILFLVTFLGVGIWFYTAHQSKEAAGNAGAQNVGVQNSGNTSKTVAAKPSDAGATATSAAGETTPASADDIAAAAAAFNAASDAAANAKACSLVTKEEMQEIVGSSIQNLATTESACRYYTDAEHWVEIESAWKGGKDAMEAAKTYNAGLFEPVADLGDEAYFQPAGVLYVRKGGVNLVINSRLYLFPKEKEMLIARKALARLK